MEEVNVEPESIVIATNGCLNEKVLKVSPAASSTTRSRNGKGKEKDVINRVLFPQNPDHRDEMSLVGKLPLKANSRMAPEREVHEPVLRLLASSRFFKRKTKEDCKFGDKCAEVRDPISRLLLWYSVLKSWIAYLRILHHCRNQRLDLQT